MSNWTTSPLQLALPQSTTGDDSTRVDPPVTRALKPPPSVLQQLCSENIVTPPSLNHVSPVLQTFLQWVVGGVRRYEPSPSSSEQDGDQKKPFLWRVILFSRHSFFWLWLCLLGFFFYGPLLGLCLSGGSFANYSVALMFLVPFLVLLLMRFSLYITLNDLRPSIVNFAYPNEAGRRPLNSKKRYDKDVLCLNRMTYTLGVLFPSIVIAIMVYSYTTLEGGGAKPPWEPSFHCTLEKYAVFFTFFIFIGVIFVAAAQILSLFLVSRLYVFRFKVLYSAMINNDKELICRELSPDTPADERVLLGSAPEWQLSAPSDEGYVQSPPSPRKRAVGQVNYEHLDNFLLVYRIICDESARHANLWSAAIIVFIIGYAFIFISCVWTIIKEMAKDRSSSFFKVEIVYLFCALACLIFYLVPVIFINSKWPALIEKMGHTWEHWTPIERSVLLSYFAQHPLIFPVMGLTITWNKVIGLVLTSTLPLITSAAWDALNSPGNLENSTNSTALS